MHFIDTHAHLYLDQFKDDIDELITQCLTEGVKAIYLPNIDSRSIPSLKDLSARFPEVLFPMMGLHPCSVSGNYQSELKTIEKALDNGPYSAIGEIGIDLYWDKTFHEEQKSVFIQQIEWAKDLSLPIVIHSRDSLDETIAIVSSMQDGKLKGIFHCFNGTIGQGKKIEEIGFYMGIGGIITYKNSGMTPVLQSLNVQSMVLETDAPYLSPVPYRGKRNSSCYIPIIAQKLADIQGMSLLEVAKITTENANMLFNTPKVEISQSNQ